MCSKINIQMLLTKRCIRLFYLIFIALVSFNCSSTVKTATFKKLESNKSEDELIIYQPFEKVPSNYETIGTVSIGDSGFSLNCGWDSVFEKAKIEARKKGGTALQMNRIDKPDFSSTCYRIEAKILRDRFHGQKRNPNCQNDRVYKVFQVLEETVLANLCQGNPDDNNPLCIGHTVLIPKVAGNVYYDEQLIKLNENECSIYAGTIEYETLSGSKKTVPVVKIIEARQDIH